MEESLNLLIVGNHKEFGEEGARVFQKCGFHLNFTPKNGISVIDVIENEVPSAVILDLFMPGLDAIGVMKSIKQRNNVKELPIFIVVSNLDNPALEKDALLSGASYFAIKPFDVVELSERISSLIISNSGTKKIYSKTTNFIPTPQLDPSKNLETIVTETLHRIGVPAHIKGYRYLRNCVIKAIEKPILINAITKKLYPLVAEEYATTPSRTERAIRHAIEVAWDRGESEILASYFGFTIHGSRGKPTNSEFIAMISDKLRLQLKSTGVI